MGHLPYKVTVEDWYSKRPTGYREYGYCTDQPFLPWSFATGLLLLNFRFISLLF
jgi:hypothetical protein